MSHAQTLSPVGPDTLAVEEGTTPTPSRTLPPLTSDQLKELGKLVRDKRNAAGLSRVKLAYAANLSDCTIKFLETARHAPRLATLLSLIAVPKLKLAWSDLPGQPVTPTTGAQNL